MKLFVKKFMGYEILRLYRGYEIIFCVSQISSALVILNDCSLSQGKMKMNFYGIVFKNKTRDSISSAK